MPEPEQDREDIFQDRLLSNIALMGRVTATEFKRETGMVRVRIGPDDEKSAEYDMPWIRKRGGNDWEWWAPEKDEQVLIISPNGDLDRAIIIGSLPYKKKRNSLTPAIKGKRWVLEEGKKPPPDNEKNKNESTAHVIQYQDKTTTAYDKKLHIFQASFLEKKTIDLKVDAKKDEEKAELKFNKDEKEKINLTIDAKAGEEKAELKFKKEGKEKVSLIIHSKEDEARAQLKFKKGDEEKISITADAANDKENIQFKIKDTIDIKADGTKGEEKVTIDVNKKTKLEMDAKGEAITIDSTGEITVKAKDITMTLDKQGGVTLKCKKLTVNSSGAVAVNSTEDKITVDAKKNVEVTAKGDVVVKGEKIKLNC